MTTSSLAALVLAVAGEPTGAEIAQCDDGQILALHSGLVTWASAVIAEIERRGLDQQNFADDVS